ncbi:hypothetical protein ROBYS_35200 [Roseobacter sp. OBYS 0001]|nr:hypothetical protein ROBYS_35200 [Roseobacter sp. OBYS 0001]
MARLRAIAVLARYPAKAIHADTAMTTGPANDRYENEEATQTIVCVASFIVSITLHGVVLVTRTFGYHAFDPLLTFGLDQS